MKYIVNLSHLKAARLFTEQRGSPRFDLYRDLQGVWYDGSFFEACNNHIGIRIKAHHEYSYECASRTSLDIPLFIPNEVIDAIKTDKKNKTVTIDLTNDSYSIDTKTDRLTGAYNTNDCTRPDFDRAIFNVPSALIENHAEGPVMLGISPKYIGLFDKVNKLIGIKGGIIMSVQAHENLPVIITPILGDCYKAGVMRIRLQEPSN